jgi:hypothetical protein
MIINLQKNLLDNCIYSLYIFTLREKEKKKGEKNRKKLLIVNFFSTTLRKTIKK